MSESVLVLVANEAYLPHAKALFANAVRQGAWRGDCALLCPGNTDTSSIEGRGIEIIKAPEPNWTMLIKFRVFGPEFRRWKRLLYLDCDILIQNDLNRACDEMAKRFPAILCDSSHTVEGQTVLLNWQYFHKNFGGNVERDQPLFDALLAKYPWIAEKPIYCTCAICFAPATIPDGTVERLFALNDEFKSLNPGGMDQAPFVTCLYDQIAGMGKDHCSWFAFDEPGNRTEAFPAIIHYWSWFAPWIVKHEGAGGHFNTRLGRVAHELYAENLAAFENEFPRR